MDCKHWIKIINLAHLYKFVRYDQGNTILDK